MDYLNQKDIDKINYILGDSFHEGIIFFISDHNYSQFVYPLLSSLNLFAKNWLIIYIQIGKFQFNYPLKENILEFIIEIPENKKDSAQLKTFCANVRVPILFELTTKININKIVYTDIDNILISDLNNLFIEKKFFIRKVNINIIDKLLNNNSKIMKYKSGVISLFSNKNLFLRDDKLIVDFVQNYRNFCELNFNKWFSDQIALSKTFKKIPYFCKFTCFDKKVCDWTLSPFSVFWAAKGNIKNSFLWKIISKKITFFSKIIIKFSEKNNHLMVFSLYSLDFAINIFLYPIIIIRFGFINFVIRLIKFSYKRAVLFFLKG